MITQSSMTHAARVVLAEFRIPLADVEADLSRTDLECRRVLPIWHPPGECPTSFLCNPEEDR